MNPTGHLCWLYVIPHVLFIATQQYEPQPIHLQSAEQFKIIETRIMITLVKKKTEKNFTSSYIVASLLLIYWRIAHYHNTFCDEMLQNLQIMSQKVENYKRTHNLLKRSTSMPQISSGQHKLLTIPWIWT